MWTKDWVDPAGLRIDLLNDLFDEYNGTLTACLVAVLFGKQVIICQKLLWTCYRVDMFFNIFTQLEYVFHIQQTKDMERVNCI